MASSEVEQAIDALLLEKQERVTRKITVEGPPDQIEELEKLLYWINSLCSVGHSASARVDVDGDGAGSLKISGMQSEPREVEPTSDRFELDVGIGN